MHIHRIQARETSCYLLQGENGTILVDAGPPGQAKAIIQAAAAAGIQACEIRLLFVTHGHLDHYGAAMDLKAWCGAPVAAHRGAPAFSQRRRNALPPAQTLRGSVIRWMYLLLSPWIRFEALQADVLLDDGADLTPYGVRGRTMRLPGHSPDSLGVITPQGDAFVGDLLVNYTVPSQPIYLSDRQAWEQSVEALRELQPHTVCVGHGDPFPGSQLDKIYPARYQMRWWVR
jgi:hydroxyacylglutathione hydrolase